jgi:hypothetical protein
MKKTTEKKFDAEEYMRGQRTILSLKLASMTKTEIVDYFRRQKMESTVRPGA